MQDEKELKKIKNEIKTTDTTFKWIMLSILWISSFTAMVANSVTANINPFTYFNILPGTSNVDCDLLVSGNLIVDGNFTSIGPLVVRNVSADAIRGPRGPQGDPGIQGGMGPVGNIGPEGGRGPDGIDGANGSQGNPGPQGPNGIDGSQGPQGPAGNPGAIGDQGPDGLPGVGVTSVEPFTEEITQSVEQIWTERFRSEENIAGSEWGRRIAFDLPYLIVSDGQTRVEIYFLQNGFFRFIQRITLEDTTGIPPSADTRDFGIGLDFENNTLAIGAARESTNFEGGGAVFIFQLNETTGLFDQTQQINEPLATAAFGNAFGTSLDLFDDLMIVSVPLGDTVLMNTGYGYIYRRDGSGDYIVEQQIIATGASESTFLGEGDFPISIVTERAIIGAPLANDGGTDRGVAYVFRFTGIAWSISQTIMPPDPIDFDFFGNCIRAEGLDLFIGAYGYEPGGAVFWYEWNLMTEMYDLRQSIILEENSFEFGRGFDTLDDFLIIGANEADSTGSVYIYRLNASNLYEFQENVTAPNPQQNEEVGLFVATSGDFFAAGAPFSDLPNGQDVGAVIIGGPIDLVAEVNASGIIYLDVDEMNSNLTNVQVHFSLDPLVGGNSVFAFNFTTAGVPLLEPSGHFTLEQPVFQITTSTPNLLSPSSLQTRELSFIDQEVRFGFMNLPSNTTIFISSSYTSFV